MIVTASDRRRLAQSGAITQLLCLAVITCGFLIPAPLSIQILIALAVMALVAVQEHIQNKIQLSQKEDGASTWLYTLVLRMAIDKIILNADRGLYHQMDWRQLSLEAFEDIKSAQEDDRLKERLGSGAALDWVIGLVGGLLVYAAFPGIGYLISLAVKAFVPGISGSL